MYLDAVVRADNLDVLYNASPEDTVIFLRNNPQYDVPGIVVIDGISLKQFTVRAYLKRYEDEELVAKPLIDVAELPESLRIGSELFPERNKPWWRSPYELPSPVMVDTDAIFIKALTGIGLTEATALEALKAITLERLRISQK